MKILKIEVEDVPKNCNDCYFYNYIDSEEGIWKTCELKDLMGIPLFGSARKPCPLNGKQREIDGFILGERPLDPSELTEKQQYVLKILKQYAGIQFTGTTKQEVIEFIGEHWDIYQKARQARKQRMYSSSKRSYNNRENMNYAEEAMEDYLMMEYCGGGHD